MADQENIIADAGDRLLCVLCGELQPEGCFSYFLLLIDNFNSNLSVNPVSTRCPTSHISLNILHDEPAIDYSVVEVIDIVGIKWQFCQGIEMASSGVDKRFNKRAEIKPDCVFAR